MDQGNKSRLIGALVCFALFALGWFIMGSKYGLEYVHIKSISKDVFIHFKAFTAWFFSAVIRFSFTAAIIWAVVHFGPHTIRRLRS